MHGVYDDFHGLYQDPLHTRELRVGNGVDHLRLSNTAPDACTPVTDMAVTVSTVAVPALLSCRYCAS
eukprot:11227239-Lingulodinium_polyedra.AAC.1